MKILMHPSVPIPSLIRAACRVMFLKSLPVLDEIIHDPEARAADKIRAIDLLGRFGLGYADQHSVHIHGGEGPQVIGVVRLPELGPAWDEPDESIDGHAQGAELGPQDRFGLLSEGDPRELFPSRLKMLG